MFFRVSVLGVYNYTAVDFMRPDMYNTIRTYLTSGSTTPTFICCLSALLQQKWDFFFFCHSHSSQHAEML